MSFSISGLPAAEFTPLFGLSDEDLNSRGVIRRTADAKPGYPCRVTLEDAEPGETLLLLNYESHKAETPYRSSYAIFVRENRTEAVHFVDEIPPVLLGRPIALRLFNERGHLIGADLILPTGDVRARIEAAFAAPEVSYIHAHNAAHGCFAAEIKRNS